MASKQFRVAILTAKEIEFDAIRRQLIEERREDNTFDGTVYRIAKIRQQLNGDTPDPKWDVAIYRTGRGQQPTTYGTQVLIQHFRPDIVLYVGVAGGDPTHADLSVGDVVVGKVVRYYERTSQKENEFTFKDQTFEPNRALVSAAEYEADDSGWLERIDGDRRNTQVFVEEIASGEKIQKSSRSELWKAIKEKYPDIIAVETEGHGFHYAVAQSSGRGLMIRSISDLLDNKDSDNGEGGTDDERQLLASKHAAAFAINLICNLNTGFLEKDPIDNPILYSVILKVSAIDLAGVQNVTQVLSEIVNDPHLKLESLQPANSFIIRVATTIHSASYAQATYRGKLISNLIGVRVLALQADAERTDEDTFDEFLTEVAKGAVSQETSNKMKKNIRPGRRPWRGWKKQ
jgi:nucleoside phosphorylase